MASSEVIRIGNVTKHRGEYDDSKIYYFGNQVTMYGSVFQAISNNFSGVPPLIKNETGDVALANTSTWNCIIDNIELYNTLIISDFSAFAKRGEAVGSFGIASTETDAIVTPKSVYGADMSPITMVSATKSSAGLMSAADKQKLDNITKYIDRKEIDSIPASIEDAIAMASDLEHSRYLLVNDNTFTVGVIDIFSDYNGAHLTEMLTTSYAMSQGVLDWSTRNDTKVYTYYRVYNINSSTLTGAGVNKGIWSSWSELIPDTITNALAKETQEREDADATLAENLQKAIDSDVYLTQDEYEALTTKDPDKTYYIYEE